MLNYRSPLFSFLLGIAFGGALGAASVVHGMTVRVEEANRSATAANEERIRQITTGNEQRIAEEVNLVNSCTAELQKANAAGQLAQQEQHMQDGWYTFLYEEDPAFVPNEQNQVVAMLADAVRPGLGKMILKMAPPSTLQLRLNGVLQGYVRPVVSPAKVRFVYTRSPQALGETFPNGVH